MATKNTATARTEKRVQVITDATRATYCAGAYWAGISQVPRAQITDAQLLELKAHKLLEVTETDVDVEIAPVER